MSLNEQAEIARVYAEGTASPADIRQRFGIAPSVLYRVLRTHGVALRGRSQQDATSRAAAAPSAPSVLPKSARYDFRVEFASTRVIEASDINDALRQTLSLEPLAIMAITRVDHDSRVATKAG